MEAASSGRQATGGSTDGATPARVALQVAVAIGSGIGVLGFVIFFGGAIIFVRLEAVGLPAVEGVARVPREVLLATGAKFLSLAALFTLGAIALLYGYNLASEMHTHVRMRQPRRDVADAEAALEQAIAEQQELDADVRAAAARLAEHGTRSDREQLERALAAHAHGESERIACLRAKLQQAQIALHDLQEQETASRIALGACALLFCVLGLALASALFDNLPLGQLMVTSGVALLTALIAFGVYASTESFTAFGLAAFVSLGIVFGVANFYATKNHPEVAPAAVLRDHRAPAAGFLVADTGSVLLLGQAQPGSDDLTLLVMPRSEIEDLVLGETTDPEGARTASLELLLRLCLQYTQDQAVAGGRGPTPRRHLCTRAERTSVASQLAVERDARGISAVVR